MGKKHNDTVAVWIVIAAGVTCVIWTSITGAIWPWIPLIGGIAVSLVIIRVNRKR